MIADLLRGVAAGAAGTTAPRNDAGPGGVGIVTASDRVCRGPVAGTA